METVGLAAGSPDSDMALQELDRGSGHLESGGEPELQHNCRKNHSKKRIICLRILLAATFSALLIAVIVLAAQRCECPSADLGSPAGPACPDGWIGYRGKCYYFSEDQGDWASSQTNCSALNASLAGIDTRHDMDFMVRYKGKYDHWIGLRRDHGRPWTWVNGTEFSSLFLIEGRGDCAYLNQEGGVSSSQCMDEIFWICSKPDVFTNAKETSVEGDP